MPAKGLIHVEHITRLNAPLLDKCGEDLRIFFLGISHIQLFEGLHETTRIPLVTRVVMELQNYAMYDLHPGFCSVWSLWLE